MANLSNNILIKRKRNNFFFFILLFFPFDGATEIWTQTTRSRTLYPTKLEHNPKLLRKSSKQRSCLSPTKCKAFCFGLIKNGGRKAHLKNQLSVRVLRFALFLFLLTEEDKYVFKVNTFLFCIRARGRGGNPYQGLTEEGYRLLHRRYKTANIEPVV